jgi:hypothetical protein
MNSAIGLKGDWKKAMQLHLGMDVWVWDVDVWWEGFGGFNVITIQNPFDCLNHGSNHVKSVFFLGGSIPYTGYLDQPESGRGTRRKQTLGLSTCLRS